MQRGATSGVAVAGRALSRREGERRGGEALRRSGHLAWRDHPITVQRTDCEDPGP